MIKKKRILIIAITVCIVIIFLLITHMPEQINGSMTVSTSNSEIAEVNFDILFFPNFVLPSYVKGSIFVDGVEYIDQYTMFKRFPSISNNRLFPSEWWKTKESVPCNTLFIRADCNDVISTQLNQINILDIVLNNGVSKIHYMYTDESNMIGSHIEGISFWGPAQNAEEAMLIAESFGYKVP